MAPIQNYQQHPALHTLFNHYPHPRRGPGFWYSPEFCQAVIHANNIGHTNDLLGAKGCALHTVGKGVYKGPNPSPLDKQITDRRAKIRKL